jgi:hypothetical protein
MTDDSKPLPPVKASEGLKATWVLGPLAALRCLLGTFRVALKGTAALQADSARLQEFIDRAEREAQDRHR